MFNLNLINQFRGNLKSCFSAWKQLGKMGNQFSDIRIDGCTWTKVSFDCLRWLKLSAIIKILVTNQRFSMGRLLVECPRCLQLDIARLANGYDELLESGLLGLGVGIGVRETNICALVLQNCANCMQHAACGSIEGGVLFRWHVQCIAFDCIRHALSSLPSICRCPSPFSLSLPISLSLLLTRSLSIFLWLAERDLAWLSACAACGLYWFTSSSRQAASESVRLATCGNFITTTRQTLTSFTPTLPLSLTHPLSYPYPFYQCLLPTSPALYAIFNWHSGKHFAAILFIHISTLYLRLLHCSVGTSISTFIWV